MTDTYYKRGALVAIINSTIGGRFLVESTTAKIMRRARDTDAYYLVDIDGDHVWRFIDAAAQSDPHSYVAKLNAARLEQ